MSSVLKKQPIEASLKTIEEPVFIEKLDFEEVKKLIPHRYPFILIDAVEDIVLNERAVGIKCISGSDPVFQGHFPHKAVFPGVLIVEAMAQTAVVLLNKSLEHVNALKENMNAYFTSIDEAKFRKTVVPGEKLRIEIKKIRGRGNMWIFQGKVYSGDVLKAEAKLKAMAVIES